MLYRFNDDGEPAGTAGKPILQAIDGQNVDGVVVVVTRWFGGIKLGAGGLARAYGGCAAECLRVAAKRPKVTLAIVRVRCDFATAAALHTWLRDHAAIKRDERFLEDGVELELELPKIEVAALVERVRDATRGRGKVITT
jgi:putative IMPACT (imprinted ancient) family translation regulator